MIAGAAPPGSARCRAAQLGRGVGHQDGRVVAAAPAVVGDPRHVGVAVDEGAVETAGRAHARPTCARPTGRPGRSPAPTRGRATAATGWSPARRRACGSGMASTTTGRRRRRPARRPRGAPPRGPSARSSTSERSPPGAPSGSGRSSPPALPVPRTVKVSVHSWARPRAAQSSTTAREPRVGDREVGRAQVDRGAPTAGATPSGRRARGRGRARVRRPRPPAARGRRPRRPARRRRPPRRRSSRPDRGRPRRRAGR